MDKEVVDPPPADFELESYAAGYAGRTQVMRLLWIASRCPALELQALRMAHDAVRHGGVRVSSGGAGGEGEGKGSGSGDKGKAGAAPSSNTALYLQVCEKGAGRLGSEREYDGEWARGVDERARARMEKLEADLQSSKALLIKESIRIAHLDVGDHHAARGDLPEALKAYVRSRDYVASPSHNIAMCLAVVRVASELGNWPLVLSYVSKAEAELASAGGAAKQPQTAAGGGGTLPSDPALGAKLAASAGLALLKSGRYKQAARRFCETSFELAAGGFPEVLTPADVALYGGLCALATFERGELRRRVIHNPGFCSFLELLPEIRDLVHGFYGASDYTGFFRRLETLRAVASLDLHLAQHAPSLWRQIRERALIQYVMPYATLDLGRMATAFGTDVKSLAGELAPLIADKQILARVEDVDGERPVLRKDRGDVRAEALQAVADLRAQYTKDAHKALERMEAFRTGGPLDAVAAAEGFASPSGPGERRGPRERGPRPSGARREGGMGMMGRMGGGGGE